MDGDSMARAASGDGDGDVTAGSATSQGPAVEARDLIGENLRAFFDSVREEETPDRFKDLLARLAAEEETRS